MSTTFELADHSNSENEATLSGLAKTYRSKPPPLPYSLHVRKRAIIITWTAIVFMTAVLPIVLFYSLWYTSLAHATSIQIISALTGAPSAFQWLMRTWALCKKNSTCRPIGGERLRVDCYHIEFTLTFIAIAALISISVALDPPIIPLFAMAPCVLLFSVGAQLLLVFLVPPYPIPFRLSSLSKGATLRPATYLIVEDIISVDGGGGTAFRAAWNTRYEASAHMRRLLHRMDVFWGAGALVCGAAVTGILWGVGGSDGEMRVDKVFWVGWSVPFIWAAVWAVLTIRYVKACLREEREAWAAGVSEEGPAMIEQFK